MEKRVTDANKVPLGRPPANYGTGVKASSGSSLLKPSYLTGDGYDTSRAPQYQSIPPPGVHIPSPHLTGLGHVASTNKMSTDYSKWSAATGFQFSANSSFSSSPSSASSSFKRENDDSNDSIETGGRAGSDDRGRDRKRKRRSRWMGNENEKAVIPGMPTILPSDLPSSQTEAYIAQLQIEELTRKLRTGDLGISPNVEDRSPSPEPIYGTDGKRLNTREYRTRKKLEEERHKLIQRLLKINPDYKPPADYRAPIIKIVDRVPIPQEEHPEINFVGLLIGPRGNTLKGLEKDTGAKIIIRGKGSVKEGKVGGKAGHPLPGEDEPLHAYVTSNNPESVKKACENIKEIIRQGIEMPESQNDLRKNQLRELALLNGTLREGEGPKCSNCGSTAHRTWHCPDKPNITNNVICTVCGGAGHIAKDCRMKRPGAGGPPNVNPNERAKIDEEYMSLMAELGESTPAKDGNPGVPRNSTPGAFSNFFSKPSAPKSIMAPAPGPPGASQNSGMMSGQPPQSGHMMHQHSRQDWNNANQPPPPGDLGKSPSAPNASPPSWGYPGQYPGYPPAPGSWGGWGGPPPPVPPPPGGTQPPPPGMYWQHTSGNYAPPPPPPDGSHRPPPPPN